MPNFPFYRFKSLKNRLAVLLLFPVFVLMFAGGALSFFYTRNLMLDQWHESAVLKLQRAAHDIEMRLAAPVALLNAVFDARVQADFSGRELVGMIQAMDGILRVVYQPVDMGTPLPADRRMHGNGQARSGHGRMRFLRTGIATVSPPAYESALGRETVTMSMALFDEDQRSVGRLEIWMGFDYLLADIVQKGWWQSDFACIVTQSGKYIAHTNMDMEARSFLGERGDPLELAVLKEMTQSSYGTVSSQGHPPETIAGFYTLEQVPWIILVFARGDKILAPIINYRNWFFGGSLCLAWIILLLIKYHTGQVVKNIGLVSDRARKVAQGEYGTPVPVRGRDEISRLIHSHNTMVQGLEERDFIRDSFGRYVDPGFAKQLLDRPEAGKLGGDRREVVILMSDIRGFTRLSESHSPEVIIQVLNRYFTRMIDIIQAHHGIIVDFFGDAVLVFFDPLDASVQEVADKALDCSFAMQNEMAAFNLEMAHETLPRMNMGIGIHSGQVIVGNIGSQTRAKYGIVGSAVNVTSRIQAMAGEGEILASSALVARLTRAVCISSSFSTRLKGISKPVDLHLLCKE